VQKREANLVSFIMHFHFWLPSTGTWPAQTNVQGQADGQADGRTEKRTAGQTDKRTAGRTVVESSCRQDSRNDGKPAASFATKKLGSPASLCWGNTLGTK